MRTFCFAIRDSCSAYGARTTSAPRAHDATLLGDPGDDTRADGATALTDGEPQTFFNRHWHNQLDIHLDVVARHNHLHPLGQRDRSGHIGRAHIELRPIAWEERRV